MRPQFQALQTFLLAVLFVSSASLLPAVYAWGAAGHEIVATLAQVHLDASVLPTICALLDIDIDGSESTSVLRAKCHLASVATWADREKYRMRWSAAMHYVGSVDDHPRDKCVFPGPGGWAGTKSVNVLDAVKNVTHILGEWSGVSETESSEGLLSSYPSRVASQGRTRRRRVPFSAAPGPLQEEALKFLVHFVGDMHQPLHLTGRDRGGNSDKVKFGSRTTNLHSAWDTSIPAKLIRTVPLNYSRPLPESPTNPLPSSQIEDALKGTIYDEIVRRTIWEGVWDRWESELETWGECGDSTTHVEHEDGKEEKNKKKEEWKTRVQKALSWALFGITGRAMREGVDIQPDGPIVCPYAWSKPIHKLNCDIVWPKELGLVSDDLATRRGPPHPPQPLVDLDTPKYMGVLEKGMVVEKLMAQGGLRLAGILNWLLSEEAA